MVGYVVSDERIYLNKSLEELGEFTPPDIKECASNNEYDLNQLDYLTFTSNMIGNANDIHDSENDNTIVHSNILDDTIQYFDEPTVDAVLIPFHLLPNWLQDKYKDKQGYGEE